MRDQVGRVILLYRPGTRASEGRELKGLEQKVLGFKEADPGPKSRFPFFSFFLVFLPFLGLLPRHMEVPRLEV